MTPSQEDIDALHDIKAHRIFPSEIFGVPCTGFRLLKPARAVDAHKLLAGIRDRGFTLRQKAPGELMGLGDLIFSKGYHDSGCVEFIDGWEGVTVYNNNRLFVYEITPNFLASAKEPKNLF